MDCKVRKSAWMALFLSLLSVVFVILVKNVDVAPVGSFGSVVGLSSVNKFFHELIGFNMFWYKITSTPGIAADVLVVLIFCAVGVCQLVERRSIFKVDKNLIALGGVYFLTLLIYILFEKYPVNYRPIILPGESSLEPSFPSTHTMLAIVVMGSAIMECKRLIKNIKTRKVVTIVLYAIIFTTIVGRIFSGVHWFTDILGGVVIGFSLLAFYFLFTAIVNNKKYKF